jgi:hypothetical protein
MGIVKNNPKRCFHCRKAIGKGEAWTRLTSPDGAFSIIVYDHCIGKG